MRTKTPQQLAELQKTPANIRNICILAHVDHGKTTLADTLVASNGIISQRLAGKLRYLDSREDEQLRGITMKSSAISLFHHSDNGEHLINLIDSPGHIDFSSEVSTAVRLCDGAVVLLDVVEGVCPQTQAVLRQAFLENIKPVLVFNKLDRLISELKMTPVEAHNHLIQLLERANAVVGELFAADFMLKSAWKTKQRTVSESREAESPVDSEKVYDWSSGLENTDDSTIYFSPDQGNVVFASALDGWGFGIDHFAQLFSKKLGVKVEVLQKTLWGDFYLESKTKMVKKGAWTKAKKPLFVQFILENIWAVYDAVLVTKDKEKIEKIVNSLNLKIPPRDAKHNNPKVHLQAICSQWLPLSKAVLGMVVEKLPSPLDMIEERVERLMCGSARRFDSLPQQTQELKQSFMNCSSSPDAPVIIFVSKMVAVDKPSLPQNRQRPLTQEELAARRDEVRRKHAERQANSEERKTEEELNKENEKPQSSSEGIQQIPDAPEEEEEKDSQVFVAFARIFSGTLKKGKQLYVLGPKHDPARALEELQDGQEIDPDLTVQNLPSRKHITTATVDDLYLFMGRELDLLEGVPAGNIVGLGGFENHILKSATVSDTIACPTFTDMYLEAMPIVRVAVEPKHASDMGKLVQGMKLLNQADHCVEVLIQETGEHVLVTAGEVHLQKCLDDLTNKFAGIKVNVSAPIVPFRETVIDPPKTDMVNEAIQDQNMPMKGKNQKQEDEDEDAEILADKSVLIVTPDRQGTLRLRASSLPESITKILIESESLIKTLDLYSQARMTGKMDLIKGTKITTETLQAIREFKVKLDKAFEEAGSKWVGTTDHIWSFGPRRVGPNILLNKVEDYERPSLWSCIERDSTENLIREYDSSIVSGFQMACLAGPLCEEPLHGVCYSVEQWEVSRDQEENTQHVENGEGDKTEKRSHRYGPLSGQLMSIMKDGCRKAFTTQPMRVVVAMYTCVINATAEVLGKLYGVLGKRNGRVLSEDMQEASSVFLIEAVLPVVESFGFCEEIRKKTSGLASPQLRFSHWEAVDVDPYWEPSTEEEYLHFGEKADSENVAKKYMNGVRKRKGLKVQEQIVEYAEKQRTLTRNK